MKFPGGDHHGIYRTGGDVGLPLGIAAPGDDVLTKAPLPAGQYQREP